MQKIPTIDELRNLGEPYLMGHGMIRLPFKSKDNPKLGCVYHWYYTEDDNYFPPHQHCNGFTSFVLKGALKTIIYSITGTNPESTMQVEERSPGILERTVIQENVEIVEACSYVTPAGESYHIHHETFHAAIPMIVGGTMTLLHKDPFYFGNPKFITDVRPGQPHPDDLYPDGWKECKSAREVYRNVISTEGCWEIIDQMMKD